MPRGRPKAQPQLTIESLTRATMESDGKAEAIAALKKAHDSEYALFPKDFWYWAEHNVITEDEDQSKFRPFPVDYEYLHKVHHAMENNNKVIILKSRRLLLSWYGMLRQLYQAMFAGTGVDGALPVYRGGVMSIGETEAKYLMQRIKRAYKKVPEWIKVRNPMVRDNDLMVEFAKGGIIQAFALKREGPQTFGFSEVFFDEMALQEAVRTVWTGLLPTLGSEGRLLAVSTPNGKGNLFYEIWSNKDQVYSGVERISLHWSENPEHDQKWFDATTSGMDRQMIARMFELSFAAYYGKCVWPDFDRRTHIVESTEVIEGKPIYIGHDFGFHYPAIAFLQRNSRDQWVCHSEFMDYDLPTEEFYEKAIEHANTFYDRKKVPEIHCVPPDGLQRYRTQSASGAVNDVSNIKQMFAVNGKKVQVRLGPNEIGTRSNEGPRLKEMRPLWRLRKDGEPGIVINQGMEHFIEGCQGGYCYAEQRDGQYAEEPSKNEYSHCQDAVQAVIVAYNRMFPRGEQPQTKHQQTRRTPNYSRVQRRTARRNA